METILSGDALPKLLELVQQHHVEDTPPDQARPHDEPRRGRGWRRCADQVTVELDEAAKHTREEIQGFSGPEALFKRIAPQTFPVKFLVLAAWHEATAQREKADSAFSGRHLVHALIGLGETPPANPARDVQQAIAQGWLARSGHRRLNVTNAGWAHLRETLGSSDDETVIV
ncbi:MAG: hypothetical protein ACKVHP_10525 [Verrucomicrobiales bacterium]|jgi:hypothetical protein